MRLRHLYIHNGTYNSLTSRSYWQREKTIRSLRRMHFAGPETPLAAAIDCVGEETYQMRQKEEPWSLPRPFYDFSITYTKMQRLMEIGRPKTCSTGPLLTSSPLAANRAQPNSCNSAARSAPDHPRTHAPNARRTWRTGLRSGPSRTAYRDARRLRRHRPAW